MEDSRCIRHTLEGDPAAYNEIVRRYEARIFSLLCMMIRDRSSAEEVAQDTFLRAFNNLTRFDQARPFYPWLASIGNPKPSATEPLVPAPVATEPTPVVALTED